MASFLTFSLRGDKYAIELERVREILPYAHPSRVPAMPACVRGVVHVRGSVVAVIDLATKLELGASEPTKQTCIAMVDVKGYGEPLAMGIVADTVDDIVELAEEAITPPPPFGAKVRLEYLRGLARAGGELLLVLEIDRILSPNELASTDAARKETARAGEGSGGAA
jgi:purine-binding chemotaxis protein CheW